MTRPSILVLSPVVPAPFGSGLAMRGAVFVEALARVGTVDVVIVPLFGPPPPGAMAWLETRARRVTSVDPAGRLDSHFQLVGRLMDSEGRAEAFARYGRPSLTARLPAPVFADVAAALAGRDYDLVHVARGYMAPLALALRLTDPRGEPPRRTLDADEDDGRLARRQAAERRRQSDGVGARFLELEAEAHTRLWRETLARFDRVWLSSSADVIELERSAPSAVLAVMENAAAMVPQRPPCRTPSRPTLLFVGALGYGPNHEALTWFLCRVWPRLARIAGLRLEIVGAAASDELKRLARRRGVRLHGFRADLAPFYRRASVVVAPLRAGAGTRIKIIEAAGRGVPVVATPLAAEALPLRGGRDIWLADTPEAFARAIGEALSHPAKRSRIARNARIALGHGHDRSGVVVRITTEVDALLSRRMADPDEAPALHS